jgi:hypothetical protein
VDFDLPGLAAHLTILYILLMRPASGIQRNDTGFSTVGAAHLCRNFGGTVAERELRIQIVVPENHGFNDNDPDQLRPCAE